MSLTPGIPATFSTPSFSMTFSSIYSRESWSGGPPPVLHRLLMDNVPVTYKIYLLEIILGHEEM